MNEFCCLVDGIIIKNKCIYHEEWLLVYDINFCPFCGKKLNILEKSNDNDPSEDKEASEPS